MTASTADPAGVFISYRHEDAAYAASWLHDSLVKHLGEDRIFQDANSIRPGDDFVEKINAAVGACVVLLAVIGKRWLTVTGEDGRRRLDDPGDFVRLEIETALTRRVRVIPVLVDGTQMPRAAELPSSLEKLARLQAFGLSSDRFDSDTGRLLEELDAPLAGTAAEFTGLRQDRAFPPTGRDSGIGPHNRGWHVAAFLLTLSLSGAFFVPFLVYKRDRSVNMNVILSLEIALAAVPGIICGIFGSRFVGEHASLTVSASFWVAAVVLCAPSVATIFYCLLQVVQYRQPEIPWLTKNARHLAAILWPALPRPLKEPSRTANRVPAVRSSSPRFFGSRVLVRNFIFALVIGLIFLANYWPTDRSATVGTAFLILLGAFAAFAPLGIASARLERYLRSRRRRSVYVIRVFAALAVVIDISILYAIKHPRTSFGPFNIVSLGIVQYVLYRFFLLVLAGIYVRLKGQNASGKKQT